jgi:flagellar basal-body rod protein FlgC
MMSDLDNAMTISSSGMRAQSERTRVIAENIANADTLPTRPGDAPFSRKIITFKNVLDRTIDADKVAVKDIRRDGKTPFPVKYMPGHPGADANGYVRAPNVNSLVEMMDGREAQRSYEANLGMFTQSRDMSQRLIDVLR